MIWPQGSTPFAVDDLVETARVLDHEAEVGRPVSVAAASEITEALSSYVAGLPREEREPTSQRLVAAINRRPYFSATVIPKREQRRAS